MNHLGSIILGPIKHVIMAASFLVVLAFWFIGCSGSVGGSVPSQAETHARLGQLISSDYEVVGLYINRDVDSLIVRLSIRDVGTGPKSVLADIEQASARVGWVVTAKDEQKGTLEMRRVRHEPQWVFYSLEIIRVIRGNDGFWYLGSLQVDTETNPNDSAVLKDVEIEWAEQNFWPLLEAYATGKR